MLSVLGAISIKSPRSDAQAQKIPSKMSITKENQNGQSTRPFNGIFQLKIYIYDLLAS
jgi:hypothetical protein